MNKVVAGLCAVTALTLGGCSLVSPKSPATTAPATQPPASSARSAPAAPSDPPTASTGPTTVPSAGANPPGSADPLGKPVATRKSSKSGEELTLTLYPVVREGAVSHLNYTLTSDATEANKVQIDNLLNDGNSKTGDASSWTADGLQLIDGKNSKVYLVASDGQDQCLCSRELIGKYVYADQVMTLSATFAAPPADVTTVDVRIPSFGTVVRVPVA